jgi:hypothetical protein
MAFERVFMLKDEEILAMLSQYATFDDFGYTVFRSDDDLLAFAYDLLAQMESNKNVKESYEM